MFRGVGQWQRKKGRGHGSVRLVHFKCLKDEVARKPDSTLAELKKALGLECTILSPLNGYCYPARNVTTHSKWRVCGNKSNGCTAVSA